MICLKRKILFIHVPKTGGNSVAEKLIPFCQEETGFTPQIDDKSDLFIENQFGLRRHAAVTKWHHALGAEQFHRLFKFTILRNPWDRLVSHYIFKKRKQNELGWEYENFDHTAFLVWLQKYAVTFDELCRLAEGVPAAPARLYPRPGYPIDFYLRTETLAEDWQTLCELVSLPYDPMQHRNKGEHAHYRKYYNQETYQEVVRRCAAEIEQFSYCF
jgi:hypothetical protein